MKIDKIKLRSIIQLFLMYFLIISHGGVIWSLVIHGSERYFIIILSFIILLFLMIYLKIGIKKGYFFYCLSTATCFFISAFINGIGFNTGLNIKSALVTDLYILIAIVTYKIDKKQSLTLYLKWVYFLSLSSLLFFSIQLIFGGNIFPESLFPPIGIRNLYGFHIYTVAHNELSRNFGLFYEPGVYEIILNIAIFLLIFYDDYVYLTDNAKKRCLIIIFCTLLSTKSTTGYISLAIIIFCALCRNGKRNKKKELISIIIVAFFLLLIDYIINKSNSIVYVHIIEKFSSMFYENSISYGSSGGARVFVIQQAIRSLKSNPLWGTGARKLRDIIDNMWYENFGTGNALFTMLATKGLMTTIFSIVPIFYIGYKNKKSKISFLCFVLLFLNTTIAQSEIWYASFILIALFESSKFENSFMTAS